MAKSKRTLSLSDPGFRIGPELVQNRTEQDIFQSWRFGALRGRKGSEDYRHHYLLPGCLQRLPGQEVSGKSQTRCSPSTCSCRALRFGLEMQERGAPGPHPRSKETRGRGGKYRARGLTSAWVLSAGFSEAVNPAGWEGAGPGRGGRRAEQLTNEGSTAQFWKASATSQ